MDAEHRHELKTNEMVKWITDFPVFARKNLVAIIVVVLVLVVLLSIGPIKKMRQRSSQAGFAGTTTLMGQIWNARRSKAFPDQFNLAGEVSFTTLANELEIAAGAVKGSSLASALVLIKRGEALRAELHYQPGQISADVVLAQMEKSRKAYQQALKRAKGSTTLTAMAKFGLGLCAEELGEFDKAQEIYNELVSEADFAATIFPPQAQLRLKTMQDNKDKFIFVKTPAQVAPAATEIDFGEALPTAPQVEFAPLGEAGETEVK